MSDTNKVIITARLTADPELRYTGGGKAVADLRLAVNRQWKTEAGEPKEEVAFVDATTWNRLAENCCQYLRKGSRVLVEARLKQENWEDKHSGERRTKLKLEAENVQFLDPPRRDDGGDDAPPQRQRGQWGNGGGNGGERRPPARQPAPAPMAAPGDDEEDIPFVDAYTSGVEPLA